MTLPDSLASQGLVLVVEDDPVFQRAIGEALQQLEGPFEIHCVGTGGEALDVCGEPNARLDLALVDLGLPDMSGVTVIRAIRMRFPDAPIMVVSVLSSERVVLEAIRAGALGYVLKGDSSLSMARAIEQILAGNYPISPMLARYLFRLAGQETADGTELPRLSNKETELLSLIARGNSYSQAAERMGVAVCTVQSYIRTLYRKLDVHSQTQAVSKARERGLL